MLRMWCLWLRVERRNSWVAFRCFRTGEKYRRKIRVCLFSLIWVSRFMCLRTSEMGAVVSQQHLQMQQSINKRISKGCSTAGCCRVTSLVSLMQVAMWLPRGKLRTWGSCSEVVQYHPHASRWEKKIHSQWQFSYSIASILFYDILLVCWRT